MKQFVQVAKTSDIGSGERKRVELNGERISIFNIKGEFFAIYDQCPHKKTAPLIRGTLNGVGVKCPNHGYRLDLKTSQCDRGERFNTRVFTITGQLLNVKASENPHRDYDPLLLESLQP